MKSAHALSDTSLKHLLWISLIVILIWIAIGLFVFSTFESWEIRGQFGDLFGATNSLFSGLAFAGLIYNTIHLQRQELGLQRRELELTRIELGRTASAQEASEKALVKQAEALETAARLNALSSVIEHYEIKINSCGSASKESIAQKSRLQYIEQLESLLASMKSIGK